MKIFSKLLSALLFILFTPSFCDATHLMGADIGWKCLGNDKYKVITTVYRDCNGNYPSNKRMGFLGSCSGITPSSQRMSSGKDITPVCTGQCTKCSSGPCALQYGIQRFKVVAIIDVSVFKNNGCCEVTISWGECCRSTAITTGAASDGLYVEGKMNICQSTCNNSPIFSSSPISIVCLGKNTIINAGAFDKDVVNGSADSLVHSLVSPMAASGFTTTWNGRYSGQKPLNYFGFPNDYSIDQFPYGFHLDSATGEMLFVPVKIEQSVLGIKVEEYRNGQKIGEIRRDAQIIVLRCTSNNPPVLSGANCSTPKLKNFNIYACVGKPICVTICASDQDKTDTIKLTCNHSIPKATYSISGIRQKNLRFCWTPKISHLRKEPYRFRVKVDDQACPFPGQTERVYNIYVGDSTPFQISTSLEPINAKCGEFWLKAKTIDNIPSHQWNWYLNDTIPIHSSSGQKSRDSFKYKFDSNGVYNVKIESSRSGCFEVFKRRINMTGLKPIKLLQLKDTSLCREKRLTTWITASGGHGRLKYFWTTNDGLFSANSDTIDFTLPQPNLGFTYLRKVDYTVIDSTGCSATDDFKIQVKHHESVQLMKDALLCGHDLDTLLPISNLQGIWSGDGVMNGRFSSKGLPRKLYKLDYYAENSKHCISDAANIGVYSLPLTKAGRDLHGCPDMMPIELHGIPKGGKWSGTHVKGDRFIPPKGISGSFRLSYKVLDSNGCENSDTSEIKILSYQANINAGADTSICKTSDNLLLKPHPKTGKWRGFYLEIRNGETYFKSAQALAENTYSLIFDGYDSIGCKNSDTLEITLRNKPNVDAGMDLEHCFSGGKDSIKLNGKPKGGIWSGNAQVNAQQLLHISKQHIGQSNYHYKFTDAYQCTNTDSIRITVRPLPTVWAGQDDTVCLHKPRYYPLSGTPANGKWTGPEISINQSMYQAFLHKSHVDPVQFHYSIADSFGCSNADTLKLFVGEQTSALFHLTPKAGNAPLKVTFTNYSINAKSYQWNFGNGSESKFFEPETSYKSSGTYKVSLTTMDETGYCHSTDTQIIIVKSNISTPTIPEGLVTLYPSPASESFVINNGTGEVLDFTLYNGSGQVILEKKVGEAVRFNIQSIPKGYYFYKLISRNGQFLQDNLIIE